MQEYNLPAVAQFHDACGIGFIAEISGRASRRTITMGIEALQNMAHRGAIGSDLKTTDGTGILVDIPHHFFRNVLLDEAGVDLGNNIPGIGMFFLSEQLVEPVKQFLMSESPVCGVEYITMRRVPVNSSVLGVIAKSVCPAIIQFFFTNGTEGTLSFENKLYLLRKKAEHYFESSGGDFFICSLSSKTLVYKGMMKPGHLSKFYHDLNDPEFTARVCLFHERFSTNTISTWSMAQPFRMLAHNGEINSIKGNRLWMHTREPGIQSEVFGDAIAEIKNPVSATGSDSFSLDNALEFLVRGGRSLFQSMMMILPEPYKYDERMHPHLRDFYIFHENHIEPWDGPAALVFTDGDIVGARLDRNGLRPLRYTITTDGLLIAASETGVAHIPPGKISVHRHMRSGEHLALSLNGEGILSSDAIIENVTAGGLYSRLVASYLIALKRGDENEEFGMFGLPQGGFDKRLRLAFGIDKEDVERILLPMASTGSEPIGSMGDDTPPAFLSRKPRKFYEYFKHHFAQVTNPPIDSIRERHAMSLFRYLGSESNLLSDVNVFNGAIRIESPVLSPREVQILKEKHAQFPHIIISVNAPVSLSLQEKIKNIQEQAEEAARSKAKIIFLTDEGLKEDEVPLPMLLVVAAVHRHLVKVKLRNTCSLICFTGDAIEDHHIACLVTLGASAVYPYMAYELIREQCAEENWIRSLANYRRALEKGLLKIMGKMGISTNSSYHGSMLLNAVGISREMAAEYFPYIKTMMGGLTPELLHNDLVQRNTLAFSGTEKLPEHGRFRYRTDGEMHGFSPEVFKAIHSAAKGNRVSDAGMQSQPVFIRQLLELKEAAHHSEKTEAAETIISRFGFGAVSFGAISEETHRTLARAAHILGMRSNTGEGGEHKDRYISSNPDKSENCYTKQIASGRFGVTTAYLAAGREIQIKIGQGAKPGEGGQLPGEKVTLSIAQERHTTPGVSLISPPPHHDIYSIEDLAQLIYDLKQVNPRADICVKLVSQYGIGIIAAGVVKAGADVILISGNDGGTGASPLGSLKHTGLPWEIGLAEVHKTLTENGLRKKVVLRVDGGLKSGRDVIIAALLGAEQYDFGTSALIALGCVMARQCHSNTCPVGIATQDVTLRKKYKGKPEQLVAYVENIAEEVRTLLSILGAESLKDITGNYELLGINTQHTQFILERNIDLTELLTPPRIPEPHTQSTAPEPAKETHTDETIIQEILPGIISHGRMIVNRELKNTDRAVGTRLSGLLSFLYGESDFKGYVQYRSSGVAGQSLGAFLVNNVEIRHNGFANDYVGKGMSGGLITIRFPKEIRKSLEGNTIIGNVALYGATGGEVFIAGKAGERFAVRNSGAAAVVEGVGNHACEYMTRGFVIILGETGQNFGAGMTGGTAFIYRAPQSLPPRLNTDYVRTDSLTITDEDLLLRYLANHRFHTGSTIAAGILAHWETEKNNFIKVVPKALDTVDMEKIYNEQFNKRLLQVFRDGKEPALLNKIS